MQDEGTPTRRPAAWAADRLQAAQAVATPNDQRIAAAALERLTLEDGAAAFAAWCDSFAMGAPPQRRS